MPDEAPAAGADPAGGDPAGADPDQGADEGEDLRDRFREALERKNAARHDPHGGGVSGRGVGPASNDKRQRQFRRKSG